MEFRVELTKTAESDLEALYLWVVERAPIQGPKWFNGLEAAINSLARHPERSKRAPESFDRARPVRVLNDGRSRHVYRVLFCIDVTDRVVNVLHLRRGRRQSGSH
ncbi:MAG: type II toxin-antitoxin system RelE/ParE family toxin [Vicinamibacterales bacterium]